MSVGFEPAVELILKHEGGYVNHPDDPGGETNFGIAKRSYPNLEIDKLSEDDAKRIYKEDYWDKVRGDQLHPAVALMVFDTAVNMGISREVNSFKKLLMLTLLMVLLVVVHYKTVTMLVRMLLSLY